MTTMATNGASPEIERTLDVRRLVSQKSHFLLGPRQTGKSFLLRRSLADVPLFDQRDLGPVRGRGTAIR
jgi:hypothetical protein